ncbi:MAG: VTC domain-containing protein [Lachnospiraceae bacterium]
MEIKTPGGIPLWMTNFLTEQKIYKTSFSKYGAAYKDMMLNKDNKNHNYIGGILYA